MYWNAHALLIPVGILYLCLYKESNNVTLLGSFLSNNTFLKVRFLVPGESGPLLSEEKVPGAVLLIIIEPPEKNEGGGFFCDNPTSPRVGSGGACDIDRHIIVAKS